MIETKFKQTEVGMIPDGWEVIPLSTLGNVKMCKRIMKYQTSEVGDIPFYKIGTFGNLPDAFISRELFEYFKSKYSYPHKGTILISAAGTIGRTVVFDGEDSYFQDSNIVWIDNDESIALNKYLYCYFNIIKWQTENGGIVTRLYNDNFKSTFLVYPKDKQEQQRIADALSNIGQLISSLSKTIEKKRLIKQGAMQQLLTGKKRLPGFDGEWTTHRIGDFLSILKGYGLSKSHLVQDGVNKCILYGELFTKYDYEIKTCISRTNSEEGLPSESGDILLPGSTTTNGIDLAKAVSVYENSIHLGGDIVVLRDKKIVEYEPYFVSAIITELCKQAIEQSSQGITIIHLNTRELRKIEVTIPSTRKEQMAIVTVLRTMDNEIESLEEERDKYIRLKEGMMQKLLTGQVRLVEAETIQKDLPIAKTANVYFKRSVLAAEIADRLCEERTFGHVKMEKLIFLTEHLCHFDIDSHYHRDAAGPYDNRALRSIDSQMKKQKWFEAKKEDKGYRYLPLQNRGGHKKYFEKYYADVMPMFEKIIDTFKTSSTEQCEIVATLYSAWDDLLQNHQPFTDDNILNEVLNNWNETKKRIKRSRWQAALDWMRANGFVPQNDNR